MRIFSKQTSITFLDRVNQEHARPVIEMKENVENMHNEGLTTHQMKAKGCGGHSLFSDNVGKVINPKYGYDDV